MNDSKKFWFNVLILLVVLVVSIYSIKLGTTDKSKLFFVHKQVPIDYKISQMMVMGYVTQSDYRQVLKELASDNISGVILYKRNISSAESLKLATDVMYRHSLRAKPFIMLDQEGGGVSRIDTDNGFQNYPSAQRVSREYKQPKSAYNLYFTMAKELANVGINFNLAPCVDIKTSEYSRIGRSLRSYGDNANVVTKYGREFVATHFINGLVPTLKHFPGIGNSHLDTHKTLPDITNSWKEDELLPFKNLIKEFPYVSVMVAHVYNKHLDSENITSLSPKSLKLLKDYGHKGLVIMDAVDMSAIDNYDVEDVLVKAINSGVDLFIFPNHFKSPDMKYYMTAENFHKLIKKSLSEGKITEEQINKSYEKIMFIKEQFLQ